MLQQVTQNPTVPLKVPYAHWQQNQRPLPSVSVLYRYLRRQGLDRSQVESYLVHGLRQAGLERPCLHPAAVELLASASSGAPRLLNLLARAAGIAAAQANLNTIGPEDIQAALELVPAARDRLNP